MTVAELLKQIDDTWTAFQAAIAEVGDERASEAGVAGDWSTRDILAHVTWFEREISDVIAKRSLVGSEWWQLHHDDRNQRIYELNKDRDWSVVRSDADSVHQRLLDAIVTLDDAMLVNPGAFADMPPDWVPHEIVAQNSYEHYRDHTREIKAWLAG